MTADDLKAFRLRLEMTQKQFATLVGVKSHETVRRWEKGVVEIPHWLPGMIETATAKKEARR